MTIEVSYVDDGRGVLFCQYGAVSGANIISAQCQILRQHKLRYQSYHVIDKSRCSEYAVSAAEIEEIAAIDCKIARLNSNIIMAVVESDILQFSLTSTWQLYVEDCIKYTCAFTNQIDAMLWVDKKLRKLPDYSTA